MEILYKYYHRPKTFIFLILYTLLLSINLSQAHSDCLFILGNTANNVYKESVAKKILNTQLSDFNEKAMTFRMLTKDAEKWKSLLTEEEHTIMKVEQHDNPLTVIIVYEGTDEMSLKEITLLSELIQYAKQFALAEIGKGTTVQTVTLLLNTAHCTHTGTLQIDSPNTVFLCNHIQFSDIPLLEPKSIVRNFDFPTKVQRKHKNVTHVTHTRRDMHYTIQEDTHDGVKHKRRRSTKQKIEEMKTLAKRARRRRHTPEKIMELPITQRKLMCKYRKSCYETGVVPIELHVQVTTTEEAKPEAEEHEPEPEEHEISEAEIKMACKYRKSCYEEFGAKAGKKEEPKKHRVLTGKARNVADKSRKKRTLKEIANKALEQVKNQEKKRHLLPEPKKIITERKLNETETKKLQKSCKYRKSCYETGKKPEIPSKYYIPIKISNILPDIYKELTLKNFTELEELEKKTFCHYRKSCYDTGVKPSMKNATQLKIKHVIKKKEEEIPIQIRCKYRKSCYGTKIPPVIKAPEVKPPETTEPPTVIDTLAQLKTHCRYRKSCYQKKLDEHEREEFLKNMEKTKVSSSETESSDEVKDTLGHGPEVPDEGVLEEVVPAEKIDRAPDLEGEDQEIQTVIKKKRTEKTEPKFKKESPRKTEQRFKPRIQKSAEPKEEKEADTLSSKTEIKDGGDERKQSDATETHKEDKKTSAEKRVKLSETKSELGKTGKRKDRKMKEKDEEKIENIHRLKRTQPKGDESNVDKEKKQDIRKQKIKSIKDEKKESKEQQRQQQQQQEQDLHEKTASLNVSKEEIPEPPTISDVEPNEAKEGKEKDQSRRAEKKKHHITRQTKEKAEDNLAQNGESKTGEDTTMIDRKDEEQQQDKREPMDSDVNGDIVEETANQDESPKKSSVHKLSCKYRKSCYSKGKKYIIIKGIHHKPEGKKHTELRCKYRKSCYETGKRPEIKQKFFTPVEELVKKIYSTETDGESPAASEQNKKLFCKYRKSCYSTGKLPMLKTQHLKTLAVTKADAAQNQLRCRYRKSCYQNSNIVLDKKTKKLKNSAKREEVVGTETQDNIKQSAPVKSLEDKRRGTTEKKVKKTDQHHKGEEDEEEDEVDIKKKSKKRSKDEKSDKKDSKWSTEETSDNEQIYKQIQENDTETGKQPNNTRTLLSIKDKLSCKYRKRCYDGLDSIIALEPAATHKAAQLISMKGLMRPNGRPCSIYYISCRKLVGLPIRQRPPIGPNGKRLCRKKPKTTIATSST